MEETVSRGSYSGKVSERRNGEIGGQTASISLPVSSAYHNPDREMEDPVVRHARQGHSQRQGCRLFPMQR